MSTIAAAAGKQREPGSARGRPGSALRAWSMLYAWSPRRRLAAALVIAVLAGASMSGACIVWDPLGVHGARAALADAQKRLDDARLAVAHLPALRGAAARTAPRAPYKGNSADDIRRVSQLAAQAALVLQALEPGAGGGAQAEAFRSIRLVAQGSFAQLRALLEALAREPVLTVPTELAIRRSGAGLSISAILHVYDALPAVPLALASADEKVPEVASLDPFAAAAADGAGKDGWRLAGIIQDRQHVVALVETPKGVLTAQAGQRIGDGRVVQVGPARVVVSAGGATHVLGWAAAAK